MYWIYLVICSIYFICMMYNIIHISYKHTCQAMVGLLQELVTRISANRAERDSNMTSQNPPKKIECGRCLFVPPIDDSTTSTIVSRVQHEVLVVFVRKGAITEVLVRQNKASSVLNVWKMNMSETMCVWKVVIGTPSKCLNAVGWSQSCRRESKPSKRELNSNSRLTLLAPWVVMWDSYTPQIYLDDYDIDILLQIRVLKRYCR